MPAQERSKLLEMSLEAQVWREVGQHLELELSVRRVAAILAEHLPLLALVIRRLDREPSRLVTVAVGAASDEGGTLSWPMRTELDPAAERALERRLGQERPGLVSAGDPVLVRTLCPPEQSGELFAMGLTVQSRLVAVALLALRSEARVESSQLERLGPALRALAVAFENDQRLQELARMREALEADREALLSRLERQDISEVVIGESGGLQSVMQRVVQVAPTDAPVLILGETGAGKEVIARAIHARSRRAKGPVVRVNCGAIPPELVDSDLFGHERGSFTGAVGSRKGWFERADGGTLFLDEIGELPLAAQVRLLRVLQDGMLERVGGQQPIRVDVRVVAATHRQLESMVAEGSFREDLWYRLSVFPIRLPALRERVEDIPPLATHFAERAGRRLGGAPLCPSAADLEALCGYGWPGNVRELATVIERAAILGNGRRLEVAAALGASTLHAPSRPPPASAPPPVGGAPPPSVGGEAGALVPLDVAMAAHIRRALAACHGRVEGPFGAAQVLGLNPHTLRARMRKLGIDWATFRPRRS